MGPGRSPLHGRVQIPGRRPEEAELATDGGNEVAGAEPGSATATSAPGPVPVARHLRGPPGHPQVTKGTCRLVALVPCRSTELAHTLGMMGARTRAFRSPCACRDGTWRSLVSALVWGTRGRRFKSGRPDGSGCSHGRLTVSTPMPGGAPVRAEIR